MLAQFTVRNSGSTASSAETVYLFDEDGDQLATQPLDALPPGDAVRMSIPIPLSDFAQGSSQIIYVTIGIAPLPAPNLRSQFSNFRVPIPEIIAAAPATPAPNGLSLPGGFSFNWNDPMQRALFVGILGVVVVLLWVITVILRLMFAHPPIFSAWQPPYVVTPLIDPNSTNGRRQLWQQHAQSDTLPPGCAPGTYMVRKLLVGSNGVKLAGWRVHGDAHQPI